MKNSNAGKKFRAVLTAAIWGAVLFDIIEGVTRWLANLDDPGSRHGWCLDLLAGIFSMADFVLAIPAAFVWETFGIHGTSVSVPYVINGFDGAVIFALVAVFWQFVVKYNGARSRNRLLYFIFGFTLFSSTVLAHDIVVHEHIALNSVAFAAANPSLAFNGFLPEIASDCGAA